MASVKDLHTSGDNEEPIFPEQYYRHYTYCDVCSSFDIHVWIEPENHDQLQTWVDRFNKGAFIFGIITFISILPAIFGFPFILGLSFIPLLICMLGASLIGRKISYPGVRCGNCGTTYANGSSFFTDLENNPRGFTMDDVPPPLYNVYWIRGESVDEQEE